MKTAAVVIDSYKLVVFKKHLDVAGFEYTEHPGLTKDTLILQVKYVWAGDLVPIVTAASAECSQ
jgi:hypothetical protein